MTSSLDKSFLKALAAAAQGETTLKESALPKRGTSAWKALNSRQKRQVQAARAGRRGELSAERQAKSEFARERWKNYVWRTKAGNVTFYALPNPDYRTSTAVSGPRGTVEILIGSPLEHVSLTKKLYVPRHWQLKELLSVNSYQSMQSALKKAGPAVKHFAAGNDFTFIPDDDDF